MSKEIIQIADSATPENWQVAKLQVETRQWVADKDKAPPAASPPGPEVDDQYWFKASKSMVEKASSSRVDAAKTVQTMIGWLWGVYTAGAIVGVTLADRALPLGVTLLVAAPVPILLIAYWIAVWAQSPVATEFDPRIPKDIRRAYHQGVGERTSRLNTALAVSFLAAIVVAIGIVVGSLSKSEEPAPLAKSYLLHQDISNGVSSLLIQGSFDKSQEILIEIIKDPGSNTQSHRQIVYQASDIGKLDLSIPTATDAKQYEVTASWKNADASSQSLTRRIDLRTTNPASPNDNE